MLPSNVVRWGGIAGVASGGVFVLLSLISLAMRGPSSVLDVIFLIAWLLTLISVAGLHAVQQGRYGLLGRAGSLVLAVGIVTSIIGTAAEVAGIAVLVWLAFPVGMLLMLVGFVLLGIATIRARVLPRWSGVILIAALPLTAIAGGILVESDLGDYPGVAVMGVAWLALGYALLQRGPSAKEPARLT